MVDGSDWNAVRGCDGDVLMEHALARFHLAGDGRLLLCAPAEAEDPAWRRLLLDSALVSAALARGIDALHAGAVLADGAAVAIAGASGAGKTTLMLALLRAGAAFLADDIVALDPEEVGVLAQPGPPVANVPASLSAGDVAQPLHRIGDEWWSRVRRPVSRPAPLRAVVVLEPGREAAVEPLKDPAAVLLGQALDSGEAPERMARRFATLARLADSATVLRIQRGPATSPEELAGRVLAALAL